MTDLSVRAVALLSPSSSLPRQQQPRSSAAAASCSIFSAFWRPSACGRRSVAGRAGSEGEERVGRKLSYRRRANRVTKWLAASGSESDEGKLVSISAKVRGRCVALRFTLRHPGSRQQLTVRARLHLHLFTCVPSACCQVRPEPEDAFVPVPAVRIPVCVWRC